MISTIIFKNLQNSTFSFSDFYSRRIRRIFPSLILVLASVFIFGWFTLYPSEYKQLGKHLLGGAGFASNFILWKESGYFDSLAESKPLLHLWSLGIEEQFYIVFPLLVWAASKKKLRIITLVSILFLASFIANVHFIHRDPVSTFYQPQTRFWELMIGSLLALLIAYPSRISYSVDLFFGKVLQAVLFQKNYAPPATVLITDFKSIFGATLIVVGLFVINKNSSFPGYLALLPTLGAALLIWAGPLALVNKRILSNSLMVWIGKISYPLYLWHWAILAI